MHSTSNTSNALNTHTAHFLQQDSNGGRSREQTEDGEAEAGNKVASVGQIDKKKIYLLLAIGTRLIIAKQYAYAYISQTSLPRRDKLNESLSEPQKKDHSKLSGLTFVGAEGFEPPTLCL